MTDRIEEIRARCEAGRPIRRIDVKHLLDRLAEAEAAVERLRDAQRWVPVSEGLPEPNVDVLVLTDAGSIRQGYVGHATGHWCSGGFVMVPTVSHWMPLPATPEEGAEHD